MDFMSPHETTALVHISMLRFSQHKTVQSNTDELHGRFQSGAAAGFFVAQHKRQLGVHKVIVKVRVFIPDRGGMLNVLFYVEDALSEGYVEGSGVDIGKQSWTSVIEANAPPIADAMRSGALGSRNPFAT
jgi:hypothetical protein